MAPMKSSGGATTTTTTTTLSYGPGRRLDGKDVAPPHPQKDTINITSEKIISVGGEAIKSVIAQEVVSKNIKFSGVIPSIKDQESMPKNPKTAGNVPGKRPDVEVKGTVVMSIVAAKVEADTFDFSS